MSDNPGATRCSTHIGRRSTLSRPSIAPITPLTCASTRKFSCSSESIWMASMAPGSSVIHHTENPSIRRRCRARIELACRKRPTWKGWISTETRAIFDNNPRTLGFKIRKHEKTNGYNNAPGFYRHQSAAHQTLMYTRIQVAHLLLSRFQSLHKPHWICIKILCFTTRQTRPTLPRRESRVWT